MIRKQDGREILLSELLTGLDYRTTAEPGALAISGLATDSRKVGPGFLFIAIVGLTVDGHDYIGQAMAKGCAAVLAKRGAILPPGHRALAVIEVEDPAAVLGAITAAFHGWPARRVTMVGITGTNGKTTTTYLLESLIRQAGGRPGVIGTVNYRYGGLELPATHTTPDALVLQELLAKMVTAGVTHVVMEVSSHALAQHRLDGILFDLAIFTNLTRDHLDFHGDMANYFAAKEQLFLSYLKPGGQVAICMEEGLEPDWSGRLLATMRARLAAGEGIARLLSCGLGAGHDVRPEHFSFDLQGITARVISPLGKIAIQSRLIGAFNLKNILAAIGAAIMLGLAPEEIAAGLAAADQVPGRLERVYVEGVRACGFAVLVDYAHTPDALENTLRTLRPLCLGRILVVFGCGGDRDAGKRPLMGEVAGRLADAIFLTSDNSRSEDSGRIIAEIELGLHAKEPGRRGYEVIADRRQAIRSAILNAAPGDVVLISGKGHETSQISRSGVEFFDDRLEARQQLAALGRDKRVA